MRIRFHGAETPAVGEDDGLRVAYAPAKRPRLGHGLWYVTVAALCLGLGLLAIVVLEGVLCGG